MRSIFFALLPLVALMTVSCRDKAKERAEAEANERRAKMEEAERLMDERKDKNDAIYLKHQEADAKRLDDVARMKESALTAEIEWAESDIKVLKEKIQGLREGSPPAEVMEQLRKEIAQHEAGITSAKEKISKAQKEISKAQKESADAQAMILNHKEWNSRVKESIIKSRKERDAARGPNQP